MTQQQKHPTNREVVEDDASGVALPDNCGCTYNCFSYFCNQEVIEHRWNCIEMSRSEKDMYIMGVLCANFVSLSDKTQYGKCRCTRTRYSYDDRCICKAAFCFTYNVKNDQPI